MSCTINLPVLIILILLIISATSGVETKDRSWTLDLPKMRGCKCEVKLKENPTSPLILPIEGVILDSDDEWLLMNCEAFQGETRKLIRIAEIESVKVIE